MLHVWLHNDTNHSSQLQPVSSSDASNGEDLHTQGLEKEVEACTANLYTVQMCT